jgi:hypothetical protein
MSKINPGKYAIYFACVLLVVAVAFATTFQRFDVLVLGAGVGLVSYGFRLSTPLALLLAGIATFLGTLLPFGVSSYATIQGFEGFKNEEEDFEEEKTGEDFEEEETPPMMGGEGFEGAADEDFEEEDFEEEGEGFAGGADEDFEEEDFEEDKPEDFDEVEEKFANYEGFADAGDKKKKKKRKPLPDHGKRAEMFQLGKKYKMPSESDDAEFHLDAGTTFMNAYKSLKPDQISAMTKDTQELINTQKQLMTTLHTLKPLITDGKQMMDTFQGYFGADGMGGLGKMAENFGK